MAVAPADRMQLNSAVTVEFVANFLSISRVDTVQQVFDAEVTLRGKTVGLASLGGAATPENWEPRIRILNMVATTTWRYRARLLDDKEMDLKWTIAGTFTETFELKHFPRDRQDLSLRISSPIPRYVLGGAAQVPPAERPAIVERLDALAEAEDQLADLEELAMSERQRLQEKVTGEKQWLREQLDAGVLKEILSFKPESDNPSVVQASNFCMASTFDLSRCVRVRATQTHGKDSTTQQVRPLLIISVSLSRHASHFLWNTELPMGLTTFFAAGTFFCERSAADRLGLSLTLVLTAVAYKFVIAADLPKISYLTKLDKYVLLCFFGIGLVVLENSLCETSLFDVEGRDLLVFYAWLALYALCMLHYVTTSLAQVRNRSRQEKRHEAESSQALTRKAREASALDSQREPLLSR